MTQSDEPPRAAVEADIARIQMLPPRKIGTEPREPMAHHLKCWPPYWEEVDAGRKTFEVRKDDRDFRVGDVLILTEYAPGTGDFTGRQCRRLVSYVLIGGAFGVATGHVVLGFELAPGTRHDFLPACWLAAAQGGDDAKG